MPPFTNPFKSKPVASAPVVSDASDFAPSAVEPSVTTTESIPDLVAAVNAKFGYEDAPPRATEPDVVADTEAPAVSEIGRGDTDSVAIVATPESEAAGIQLLGPIDSGDSPAPWPIPKSTEEMLRDRLGEGGEVRVESKGFRVRVANTTQFGHGSSISEALYDIDHPKLLDQ